MEVYFGKVLPALLILLCLSSFTKAQDNNSLDSLLRLADDPRRLPESTLLLLTDQVGNYPLPVEKARLNARISAAYLEIGQLDSAAANAFSVLALVPGNSELSATAYLSLGLVAFKKSALERAADFFEKALYRFEVLGNKNGQLVCWNYQARIADRQALLLESVQDYQKSMAIATDLQDSIRLRTMEIELADVYRRLKRFPEAENYLNRGFEEGRQRRDTTRTLEVLVGLGRMAEDQSYYPKALDFYLQALRLNTKWGRRFLGYNNVSRVYGEMANLDSAQFYADSAQVAAVEGGRPIELRACFQWRYQLAEQMGDTAKTLLYYRQYVQYDDSVTQDEMNQRIENVHDELILGTNEASIRTAELELKLNDIREERDQQWQNFLFLLSGALALIALFLFFWFRSRGRAEARIHEMEQRVAELTLMKEKLFTVVAHDLHGPLSSFTGLTQRLVVQTNKISPEDLKLDLDKLNGSGLEVTITLNKLLEWAVTQSGTMPFQRELVNCKQLADEVERQVRPLAADKKLEVAFLIPNALHAYGDRSMITIVLRTLLHNAIRFTPAGSTITLFSGRKDDLITLGVKDHGSGISAERMKRIFDWSRDGAGVIGTQEMGIGLPMCKELVSRNGGNLYVESTLNEGSTFYFTLPEHVPMA